MKSQSKSIKKIKKIPTKGKKPKKKPQKKPQRKNKKKPKNTTFFI
jgi:hypothetical protein